MPRYHIEGVFELNVHADEIEEALVKVAELVGMNLNGEGAYDIEKIKKVEDHID